MDQLGNKDWGLATYQLILSWPKQYPIINKRLFIALEQLYKLDLKFVKVSMKRLSAGLATTLLLTATAAVQAGTYEAMCGETKCTVNINGRQINTPLGSIPAKRVTQWGLTGKSKTNISTGVWTTVLFGPIGLLGFTAKHSDYNFLVNGYNKQGDKTSLQFKFKNNKPVESLMQEMPMVTGIGMGEIRTALEIKKNEGLLKKCWWGPWNCSDPLEGQTIEPENLFETTDLEQSFPKTPIGIGAVFALLVGFLFLKKNKKEEPKESS